MVANLEVVEGRVSMMYAADDGLPWHGEGTRVEAAVTYEEALELANMAWDVEQQKIRLVDGPQIQRWRANVRTSDRKVLGITTPDYQIIQNKDVGAFMDSLYQDGKLLYSSAGVIDNGKAIICWLLARLTEDMRIRDDAYGRFLLASWSHDGTRSARFDVTNVRVVCENTLTIATGAAASALIRHTGDVAAKMETARKVLAISDEKSLRLQAWLNRLAETPVDETHVAMVQERVFGSLDDETPAQRRNAIEKFLAVYAEEASAVGQNAYALATAITGYADHKTRITKNSSRMASMLIGTAANTKAKGMRAVADVVRVPMKI